MLYLLGLLEEQFGPLRLFEYVTFRAGGAAFTSFLLVVFLGGFTARKLRKLNAQAADRYQGLFPQELIDKYNAIVQPCVDLYAGYNNGWFVMPILCGGTTLLSTWLMQRGQPQAANAAGSNKMMMYLMPAMTFVFSLSTNAAFALYWTVSNVISMITTFFINKSIGTPGAVVEVKKS